MDIYTGIDIIEIERFRDALKRQGERFLKRIYTVRELQNIPRDDEALYLCISFSFKESAWKALPEKWQRKCYFRDIEIIWKGKKPEIVFKKLRNINITYRFFTRGSHVVTLTVLLLESHSPFDEYNTGG